MPKQHPLSPLEEALEAWTDARTGLAREAQNIPAARYGFRPSPGTRTVTELLWHVLEVAAGFVTARALAPVGYGQRASDASTGVAD